MERTQIYLTRRESSTLARLARETGRTRSQLIREAIAAQYIGDTDSEAVRAALKESAGLWADRDETGKAYVERVRRGSLAKRLGIR